VQEEMVYEWLNPVYLKPDVQEQIREKFEADSEIELQGFLKVCKFTILVIILVFATLTVFVTGRPQFGSMVMALRMSPKLLCIESC